MKIESINRIGDEISIITEDGNSAVFYKWGLKDIYTTTSPGLYKYEVVNFKKAILRTGWDVEQLKKQFIL